MSEFEKKIREIHKQLTLLLPEAKHVREDVEEAISGLSLALLNYRSRVADKIPVRDEVSLFYIDTGYLDDVGE